MSEEIKKEAQDVELNPEDLDNVAGGIIKEDIFRDNYGREQKRYTVFDERTGKLVGWTTDKDAAIKFAEASGVSTDIVTFVHEMKD